MIRTQESTGKTVDEAFAKACALLGVQAEDENVSREVLEYPQKTGDHAGRLYPEPDRGLWAVPGIVGNYPVIHLHRRGPGGLGAPSRP